MSTENRFRDEFLSKTISNIECIFILHTPLTGKICKICNNYKLLNEFGKRKGNRDGLSTSCKFCYNKKERKIKREQFRRTKN